MDQNLHIEEHGHLLEQKIALIHLVYTICGAMLKEQFFAGLITGNAPLDTFVEVIGKFVSMPRCADEIMIRLRGVATGAKISPAVDYEVATNGLTVDFHEAMRIARQRGVAEAHLQGRLLKAWKLFKQRGITSLVVRILEPTEENQNLLRNSVRILAGYYQAVQHQKVVIVDLDGEPREVPICTDQRGQPDPNMTLFAGLNDLSQENISMLLSKVIQAIPNRQVGKGPQVDVTSPAEILYEIDVIKKRLKIPPIKINTLKSVPVDEEEAVLPQEQLGVVEAITAVYRNDEKKRKSVMYYVSDTGLNLFNAEQFVKGLECITDFLVKLERLGSYPEAREEIRATVEKKILALSRPALIQMEIGSSALRVVRPGREPLDCEVLPDFVSLIKETKLRSDIGEKLKRVNLPNTTFTPSDLNFLAADFHLPVDQVDLIIKALRRSFNTHGQFDRAMFAEQAGFLAVHQKQVFPLLLDFLKRAKNKKDRLALLNSLPLLFERVERPREVITTLLQEFCSSNERVHHFDRNLVMLVVQLLRHYRKEAGCDIEATPEEVLLVKKGLVEEAVFLGQRAICGMRNELRIKTTTIRKYLVDSLAQRKRSDAIDFSARFLISLLRESYILLALLGGTTAHEILGEAAINHADPESSLYRQSRSTNHLSGLLGLLKVAVKGYSRVLTPTEKRVDNVGTSTETGKSIERLATLRSKLESFLKSPLEEGNKRLLRQVIALLEK